MSFHFFHTFIYLFFFRSGSSNGGKSPELLAEIDELKTKVAKLEQSLAQQKLGSLLSFPSSSLLFPSLNHLSTQPLLTLLRLRLQLQLRLFPEMPTILSLHPQELVAFLPPPLLVGLSLPLPPLVELPLPLPLLLGELPPLLPLLLVERVSLPLPLPLEELSPLPLLLLVETVSLPPLLLLVVVGLLPPLLLLVGALLPLLGGVLLLLLVVGLLPLLVGVFKRILRNLRWFLGRK